MAEYIDREAAIAALNKVRDDQRVFKYTTASDFLSARDAIERAIKVLESLPATDVEPVRHGRWVSVPHKLARVCSVRNRDEPYKFADIDADVYDYCPNCGARRIRRGHMNVRQKLVELLQNAKSTMKSENLSCDIARNMFVVDFMMDNGVTVKEWIPVTERLPQGKCEVCKNVNLLMDDGIVTVGWLNENTGKAYYLDTWNDVINRVPISRCTHWMPLPEPPKGE